MMTGCSTRHSSRSLKEGERMNTKEESLRDYAALIHFQMVFEECQKDLWLSSFAIRHQLGDEAADRFYELIHANEYKIKCMMKDATEKARKETGVEE